MVFRFFNAFMNIKNHKMWSLCDYGNSKTGDKNVIFNL